MNFFDQKSHQKQMRRKKVSKMKDFIQLWSIKLKLSLWRVCGRLSLIQVEFKHFLENELRTFIAIIFIAVRCNVSYMCKIHHCKLQKNLQTEDWKRMRCHAIGYVVSDIIVQTSGARIHAAIYGKRLSKTFHHSLMWLLLIMMMMMSVRQHE